MVLASLDLLIGLVVVYLLLSLVVSAVREAVEARVRSRSTHLATGIVQLLGDAGAAGDFYDHPLVQSLYRSPPSPQGALPIVLQSAATFRGLGVVQSLLQASFKAPIWKKSGVDLPSYIPARTFSLTMFDLALRNPAIGRRACELAGAVQAGQTVDLASLAADPSRIYPALRAAILESARGGGASSPSPAAPTPSWVKAMANALLVADSSNFDDGRKALEAWFNATMDRVSGWYKRESQSLLFWFGAILAIALNVDSISLVQHLSASPETRKLLVDRAASLQPELVAPAASGADPWRRMGDAIDQANALNVPIGWNAEQRARIVPHDDDRYRLEWTNLGSALIGWFMTAFAISFGAPFWFDVLNKIMVVRSTVKPTEKSPEEKSKEAAN